MDKTANPPGQNAHEPAGKATPVKVIVDKPANVWSPNHTGFDEHRVAYTQLVATLLVANQAFEVVQMRPFVHRIRSEALSGAIYYAYHADQPGPNTYCFKGGPLPYLWYMDRDGYSGWSQMAISKDLQEISADYPLEDATKTVAKTYTQMRDQNLSNQPQPAGCDDIGDLQGFVFYPLQVNDDSVMELTEHAQADVIKALCAQAKKGTRPLVIKRHPLCSSTTITQALEDAQRAKKVHITTGSVNALLERAHSVVVTNSSVGFQALIARKPVYTLGRSEYAHMTTRLEGLKDLKKAFAAKQPGRSERATRQLGFMLDRYFVDMRDPARVNERLQEHLAAYVPDADAIAQQDQDGAAQIYLSTAHALNRQVREQTDFLLAQYPLCKGDAREQIAASLVRLARAGHLRRRILAGSDGAVSARVMRFHIKAGEWDTARAVANELLDKAPEGTDASLRTLVEAATEAEFADWPLEIITRAADLPDASFATLVSFVEMGLDAGKISSAALYKALVRAHPMRPKNAVPAWLEARIAARDGNIDDALIALKTAIKLDPKQDSYKQLRTALRAQKQAQAPADPAN